MKHLILILVIILTVLLGTTCNPQRDVLIVTPEVRDFPIGSAYLPLLSCSTNPNPTPTPTENPPNTKKGLAMCHPEYPDDLDLLGVSWYYVWSASHVGREGNIPMSRCGEMVAIPRDTEYLLVFNEPNNREPAGCPVTPNDAVALVMELEKAYPDTYMVVGNVHPYSNSDWGYPMYGHDWLAQFFDVYGRWTMGVGVHSYDRSYNGHVAQWNDYFDNLGRDYDYWLTEFNLTGRRANDRDFEKLVNGANETFDHYAVFTNRSCNSWVPMIDDGGALTSYGIIYAEK